MKKLKKGKGNGKKELFGICYKLFFREAVIPRLDRGIQFFNMFWIVRSSRTMTENDFVNKLFFDYLTISPSPYFTFLVLL